MPTEQQAYEYSRSCEFRCELFVKRLSRTLSAIPYAASCGQTHLRTCHTLGAPLGSGPRLGPRLCRHALHLRAVSPQPHVIVLSKNKPPLLHRTHAHGCANVIFTQLGFVRDLHTRLSSARIYRHICNMHQQRFSSTCISSLNSSFILHVRYIKHICNRTNPRQTAPHPTGERKGQKKHNRVLLPPSVC